MSKSWKRKRRRLSEVLKFSGVTTPYSGSLYDQHQSDKVPPRRQLDEVPLLVERLQKTEQGHDQTQSGGERLTYEEANWAKLSPTFRLAHNKLRQARGLPTIPPPLVDLYVKPQAPVIRPFDPSDKEVQAAIANAKFFDGGGMIMGGGSEGFSINGKLMK